ncbi:Ubiquitin carboxyl-terminal hydrolase family protein [Aphelenchoides avenae]|nr:Ubiquitin carboxyl-terminal hydrolase family protein [Aphelenchus avenae]
MAETAYSYASFEELKASCDFDNGTMRQLKNMSCAKCLPLVMKMLEQARFHEHEGRLDQAFKLYRRSTDICDMVRQKKDFSSFRSTPDARMFHEMFQKSLERLEKAGELVKANYAATQALAFEARSVQEKEIEATQPTKQEEKPTVHSKTLHAIVEKENKQVLVIDFRSDRSSMFRHSNPLFVVVSVDPAILVPGCIMSTLMQSIEVSKRAKLWQLEQYEVVVLVGDDVRSSFVEYRKDSPTSILLSALTSYNTTSKPKKHPVLLEGGFSSWSYAYPMYVSRDQPETRKFFDSKSEFSVLVAKMRELSVVDVEYPDLLPKPKPRPAPRETLKSAITPPREASPTPGPCPNSDNDATAPYPKAESYTSSEEITNPTTALPDQPAHQTIVSAHETVRPPVQPIIPQVDRSKKPTIYDTSAQVIPSTDAAHKQIPNGIHLDQPHLPERNPQPHDADNARESSKDAKANGSSDQAFGSRHEYVPGNGYSTCETEATGCRPVH